MCIRDSGQRIPKKILREQVYKSRKGGRPRIRLLDDVLDLEDVALHCDGNGKETVKKLVLEPRAHVELC